jgi:adenylate kinase
MEAGGLVPDDVMVGIVRDELSSRRDDRGFILDGFPRTLTQAEALVEIFSQLGIENYLVVNFRVDDEEIVKRLSSRLVCEKDGSIYSSLTGGVVKGGKCPDCGATLIQRDDDGEETIRKRLVVYHNTTRPLIDFYRERGRVVDLDGMGAIENVNREIKRLAAT